MEFHISLANTELSTCSQAYMHTKAFKSTGMQWATGLLFHTAAKHFRPKVLLMHSILWLGLQKQFFRVLHDKKLNAPFTFDNNFNCFHFTTIGSVTVLLHKCLMSLQMQHRKTAGVSKHATGNAILHQLRHIHCLALSLQVCRLTGLFSAKLRSKITVSEYYECNKYTIKSTVTIINWTSTCLLSQVCSFVRLFLRSPTSKAQLNIAVLPALVHSIQRTHSAHCHQKVGQSQKNYKGCHIDHVLNLCI